MKKVYIGMTADFLHHGHINIIQKAKSFGDVMIGLLTDSAIADHKRLPYLSYEHRKTILENIDGVTEVVPQESWDYAQNISRYKPDIFMHGDDWLGGPLAPYRKLAIAALSTYGGELVEIPYTPGISSQKMHDDLIGAGTTAQLRQATLRRLIGAKSITRVLEAHSPLSALIGEHTAVEVGGKLRVFDAFWSSSLTDSTVMGKPDIEALDMSSRLSNINSIFEVTRKPLIIDGDTGGKPEHFEINVKSMERLGISAVIIEDKKGLKKNSLFGNDVSQQQEDPQIFCEKIQIGRAARVGSEFMVIARIESLILEKGMKDALQRAEAYVEAGADGIMIHSRNKLPDEIFEFAKIFRKNFANIPLVSVPTSYNHITDDELAEHGFNIVIYANHLLRASYPSMSKVAHSILSHGRTLEVDRDLMNINEILELIPGTK